MSPVTALLNVYPPPQQSPFHADFPLVQKLHNVIGKATIGVSISVSFPFQSASKEGYSTLKSSIAAPKASCPKSEQLLVRAASTSTHDKLHYSSHQFTEIIFAKVSEVLHLVSFWIYLICPLCSIWHTWSVYLLLESPLFIFVTLHHLGFCPTSFVITFILLVSTPLTIP